LYKQKYFYLHIPKTAGTTFNNFLKRAFSSKECLFHIENKLDKLENKRVIGGHIILPKATKVIPNFEEYIKLTVFRNPLEQVSSHLRFVKKLGESSEYKRLEGHSSSIKRIVSFLWSIDFSNVEDIKKLINWLEENNYVLFHNTQIQYLIGSKFHVTEEELIEAENIIEKIEYIGITERLDDYIKLLTYKLDLSTKLKSKNLNITVESYGLDITNPKIVDALEPLICYDKVIYKYAKDKFEKEFNSILSSTMKEQEVYGFLDRIVLKVKNIF